MEENVERNHRSSQQHLQRFALPLMEASAKIRASIIGTCHPDMRKRMHVFMRVREGGEWVGGERASMTLGNAGRE